jgi:DNA-binding SARP family transcriptional activator/tetratricopeptide (TPR) repeat protein
LLFDVDAGWCVVAADTASLRVELLGPLRVVRAGAELRLGPARQQAVFAVLAMRINQIVARDELIDGVWGDAPPLSVEGSVHTYVSGLRRVLDPAWPTRALGQGGVLASAGHGYVLQLDPGAVDVVVFDGLRQRAKGVVVAGDLVGGRALLGEALGLWRGEALAGVPGPYAAGQRVRLGELRLAVVERRAEVLLGLGRSGEAVMELSRLVAEFPFRESLRGLLMLALYRSGRAADALEAFRTARAALIAELGIEPGPELQRLQQRILSHDPSLTIGGPTGVTRADVEIIATGAEVPSTAGASPAGSTGAGALAAGAQGRVVAAQLPHKVAGFAGRQRELAWLRGLIRSDIDTAEAGAVERPEAGAEEVVLITAIDGCGGVGKTALAVRFAHQVAGSFPDGQLYVDLRGFDPASPPLRPAEALRRLLRGLGFDPKRLPEDTEALAGLYRSLLAGRRVLVLLDNAASSEQVQPLLPGTAGCLAVVTSRSRLGALVARHGARRLTLDVLDLDEATGLLTRLLGPTRVGADSAALSELITLCGGFPLALRIAAERLLVRAQEPIGELVADLRDERERLDLLAVDDDPTAAVRGVFSWSYQALKPEPARLFRLLSLHPGPEFSGPAAAALAGNRLTDTAKLLRTLVEGHLLEPVGAHRYRMHDLLRLYAVELVAGQDSDTERDDAVTRVLGFYVHSVRHASTRIDPGRMWFELDPPPVGTQPLDFGDTQAALDWLDREQANLPLAVHQAHQAGHYRTCWQFVDRLRVLYNRHRTSHEGVEITTLGLAAAEASGDRYGQARMLVRRALVLTARGQAAAALDDFEQAKTIWTELGDTRGTANVLNGIGIVYAWVLGEYARALQCFLAAAETFESVGSGQGHGMALANVGLVCAELGRYDEAIRYGQQSTTIFQDLGSADEVTRGRVRMAQAELMARRPELALPVFIDIYEHHRDALSSYHLHALLLGRASCHRALGQYDLAIEYGAQTAAAAWERDPGMRAQAMYEMGHAHLGLGHPEETRRLWQQALAIYDVMHHSRADKIRSELADLETPDQASE